MNLDPLSAGLVPRPTRTPLSLSVFFPCYNEEGNVEHTTENALRALRELSDDFEIIIVNDGSTDRTAEIAGRLADRHPEVRVVNHARNIGYGGALQSGFRAARKPWVFYTDGDGQFDCREIALLLPLLDRYHIVSAYRLDRRDSMIRRFNAACWTLLVDLVLGLRLRDIDCAFKIYPRRLFEEIPMKSSGALIDAEILARARRRGYTIGQIGVHHLPRTAGRSTGGNPLVILRAFMELFALTLNIRRTRLRDVEE